jgi:hypothetical protein
MIKKFDDEKSLEIKNYLQEIYIDEGYESLEDFEKDYYSFKPVSARDLIAFYLQVNKKQVNNKMDYDFNFIDQYCLFFEAVFNRPNIKPTTTERGKSEKKEKKNNNGTNGL